MTLKKKKRSSDQKQESTAGLLDEYEAMKLLERSGIGTVPTRLAKSREEAVGIAEELGFPVVCKISAQGLLHKTEAGGVLIGIRNADETAAAWDALTANAEKGGIGQNRLRGIIVQQMVSSGIECIIGGVRDDSFGPSVMFGLGGIYAELYRDVAFRLAPLTEADAFSLIGATKAAKLLAGFRGKPAGDIGALASMLVAVGRMMDSDSRIVELDINPCIVRSDSVLALDAMIRME